MKSLHVSVIAALIYFSCQGRPLSHYFLNARLFDIEYFGFKTFLGFELFGFGHAGFGHIGLGYVGDWNLKPNKYSNLKSPKVQTFRNQKSEVEKSWSSFSKPIPILLHGKKLSFFMTLGTR